MPFKLATSRRAILRVLGASVALAAGVRPGSAAEMRIGRLIDEARGKGSISQKIDFISGALRGTRYQGYTLIGGPQRPEQFVVRDDAFDCVTFCETVVAAAIAGNPDEFDSVLRKIRYHNGVVSWRERNHYFFEWGQHNIENKICRPLVMPGSIEIEKNVYWHKELGKRRFSIAVIPRAFFLANKSMLANGDIVGFITQRPIWTISMLASSPSAVAARCCCGTLRKAATACLMNVWTVSSRPTAYASSRCCGHRSRAALR